MSSLLACCKRLKRGKTNHTDGDTLSLDGVGGGSAGGSVSGEGRGVAELLLPQYALLTGGRSRDGCPLITLPDNSNFHSLTVQEYQRLLLYLTTVPSLQDADLGFNLIVDRRKDRWNSVKMVLLRISEYFPGIIHAVFVLRPAGFFQKAISEVSNKLFREEFKFKVIVCATVEELSEYVDKSQLTADLGGDLAYSHPEWIQQRITLIITTNLSPPEYYDKVVLSDSEPDDKNNDCSKSISSLPRTSIYVPTESLRNSFNFDMDDVFSSLLTKYE